jgi:DNA-binding transcriptional LysR family regulator
MNIHHLELFYYVARYGGIMPAVRNIPYGIQQPAVSSQVAQLEDMLGTALFQRRPFALTPQGEKLYQFIEPFFSNLGKIADELQGGRARHIRIGASTIVLRDHLPELLQRVRRKFAALTLSLREGFPAHLEKLLSENELDLAITVIEQKPARGIHAEALLELPMVLLVEGNSPITSEEQLWQRDRIEQPLICLPQEEPLCKAFRRTLENFGVDWFASIEAPSIELIETYVAAGMGIGLSVAIPNKPVAAKVRALPLPRFSPVIVGAMWRGRASSLVQAFLSELKLRAEQLTG